MSHYDSIEAYTADVTAAREAYAADQRVAQAYCETGDGRKTSGPGHRLCSTCRRKKKEAA